MPRHIRVYPCRAKVTNHPRCRAGAITNAAVAALKIWFLRKEFAPNRDLGAVPIAPDAPFLLDFLRSVRAETIYLVGDIVDLWSLKRGFYWPQAHQDVLRTLLELSLIHISEPTRPY